MSFVVSVRQLLLACILVLGLQRSAQVHAGWPFSVSAVPQVGIEPNVTITGYITEVQATIQNLESQPACIRLAHKTLLNACGAYDQRSSQSFRSTDEAVQTFREVFAIQRTSCEMDEALQEMPTSCQPLLRPLSEDPRPYISECLSSLHDSNPNTWTSYMHNKHSGDAMCRLMRTEIDKEEQLDNFRQMLNAVQKMGYVMYDHSMALDEIVKLSQGMGPLLREVYSTLQHENEQLRASFKQSFNEMAKDMSAMGEGVNSVLSSVGLIDESFHKHLAQVGELFERVESFGTNVDTWSTGMAVAREEFGELQARVQMQLQQLLQEVFKKVYELTADVTRANEDVGSLAGLVDSISSGMDNTFSTLQGVNFAADNVQHKMGDINKQLDDIAVSTNNTQEAMQLVNEQVEMMQSCFTIASTLLEGFLSTMRGLTGFGLYYVSGVSIVMLCLSFLGMKLLNVIIISSLLGSVLAYVVLVPLVSLMKAGRNADAVSEEGLQMSRQFLLYGACFCMLVGAAIKTAFDRFTKRAPSRDTDIEYDPASPQYLPTAQKYSI
ncbi:hypothetical protein PRZ48_002149 [Zasmidium cellare]|uniref:Uncharacterized protein n=1 Tax=Zasmidium cellare TaxID=395010 RepID=A0ABR0F382_ZASCE|nr:hypothetical protein PRZ48_002149 [Zasmidium cellare]